MEHLFCDVSLLCFRFDCLLTLWASRLGTVFLPNHSGDT